MVSKSLSNYRDTDLAEEIVRRIKQGKNLRQFSVLEGRTITFYGLPREGSDRSRIKEGSQRWLHLRNVVTDRELMKEMQDRILRGEMHAYNEYTFALKAGLVAEVSTRYHGK